MLISIAFFTIIERKILGIFHFRIGPNKIGLIGLFQPFSDALKLFSKNLNVLVKINEKNFIISPLILFSLFLLIINFFPIKIENNLINENFLILILLIRVSLILIFSSRFFSFRKYRIIRSKRAISQILSYEIGLIFILIFLIPISINLNILKISLIIENIKFIKLVILTLLFLLILIETRRIPFDFIERESELVSGFNTEFSRRFFSLFFIFEYGIILFFRILISFLYFFIEFFFFFLFIFIIIRASFPRFRYDQIIIYI